jgi:dipeptidyl aminopeptidase/acylaminoacyl peptidase
MSRSIQRSAFALRGFSVGLAIVLLVGTGPPYASAGEEKADGTHDKIVVYAQFLAKDRPDDQEWGLHVVDPVTNAWSKLAEYQIQNGFPVMSRFRVSPDGTRLAFNEYMERGFYMGESSIWLRDLRPDATPRKLCNLGGRPIWSPDGKHLIVVLIMTGLCTVPGGTQNATLKIDADGSHPVSMPIPGTDLVTDWSPDGQWLVAYSRIQGDGAAVHYENVIMHPDGTGRRRLPGPGVGVYPRFSPDSKRIAYVTLPKAANTMRGKSVWVVEVEGKVRRSVYMETQDAHIEDIVTWSPDGKQLATIMETWTPENGALTPKNPRLCLFNVEDRRMRIIPHPPATLLGHPEWR